VDLWIRASHGDDELAPGVSLLEMADRVGDLDQRVGPVDGGREFPGTARYDTIPGSARAATIMMVTDRSAAGPGREPDRPGPQLGSHVRYCHFSGSAERLRFFRQRLAGPEPTVIITAYRRGRWKPPHDGRGSGQGKADGVQGQAHASPHYGAIDADVLQIAP